MAARTNLFVPFFFLFCSNSRNYNWYEYTLQISLHVGNIQRIHVKCNFNPGHNRPFT
jgi:hypothetical protein